MEEDLENGCTAEDPSLSMGLIAWQVDVQLGEVEEENDR